MVSNENDLKCPKCKSKKISSDTVSEYTGGGYADTWEEFICEKCSFKWRSEEKMGFY